METKLRYYAEYYLHASLYSNAAFFAERYFAQEPKSQEALYLLATIFFRSGQINKTYLLLKGQATSHENRYLFAHTCLKLNKHSEAEIALVLSSESSTTFDEEVCNGAAGLYLLGQVCRSTQRERAIHYFRRSLQMDPFMWCAYEALCKMGENVDPNVVFSMRTQSLLESSLPNTPSVLLDSPFSFTHSNTANSIFLSPNLPSPIPVSGSENSFYSSGKSAVPSLPKQPLKQIKKTGKALFQTPPERKLNSRLSTTSPEKITFIQPKKKEPIQVLNISPIQNIDTTQSSDIIGINAVLGLLRIMGEAFRQMCFYKCKEAIEIFQKLPSSQLNTGWVSCQLARAHYEMVNYVEAKEFFEKVRKLEPYRTEGMDVYSTTLWHLRKEFELSYLAQEFIEFDKLSPESWCIVGNCFSLQNEHDSAIKFFQRALQIDPNFTYAYTLCGHEYVSTDDFEKALSYFRNALRIDERHYNAWYGLGMIYFRQEKYEIAEYHFRRAISINANSSVLHCYLGMVLLESDRLDEALKELEHSLQIDPKNTLAKFKKAATFLKQKEFKLALTELKKLREIVPKEASIYILMGEIFEAQNQPEQAVLYYTTALDLDNKSGPALKPRIERLETLPSQN